MALTDPDAQSLRANVNECGIWLAAIFAWLTPYPWYWDLVIALIVGVLNWVAIEAKRKVGQ